MHLIVYVFKGGASSESSAADKKAQGPKGGGSSVKVGVFVILGSVPQNAVLSK